MYGALSRSFVLSLNESPRPKAGKYEANSFRHCLFAGLNESPRPKAGKCGGQGFEWMDP